MWIFLHNAFLSIVAPAPESDAAKQECLIVRARVEGDIDAVFPGAIVSKSPRGENDYAFRAAIPRALVAQAISNQVTEITTTNFKNSVLEGDRRVAYERVWAMMNEFQTERGNPGLYALPMRMIGYDLDDSSYDEYLKPGRRSRGWWRNPK